MLMNTEFEQRLRADMEQATHGVHVPPGLALKARRHHRQRTITTRVVAAAGAVAMLTAGTLSVAGASGAFGRPAGRQQAQTDAYVISRVERALAAPRLNDMIGHTRTVYPAGITLQPVPGGMNGSGGSGRGSPQGVSYQLLWAYHHISKSSAFTAAGQRLFSERITAGNGSLATTVVNYTSHTWWTAHSARPAVTGPAPATCLRDGGIRLGGGGNAWPVFIRSQLACGAYTVVGKQAVGGVDALKITGSAAHLALWVRPATYLPIRLQVGPLQMDFQWLPATPANLAMLNMPVPASFHQVAPPS